MFLERLEESIAQGELFQDREKLLIAVSGGPDSLALLHGLWRLAGRYGWQLYVVHVNHQLRGQESEEDAAFVAQCCEKWQIPYEVEAIDLAKRREEEGGNLQALARKMRYQVLADKARKWQIKKIVLGHHADDQVETILMRLLRGTGISGLKGMEQVTPWRDFLLVRPMLTIPRNEIEQYCEAEHLHPRMDSSNFSTKYTRNRIRRHLLPILETYNPRVKEALLHLSEIVREEEKVWEQMTIEAYQRIKMEEDERGIFVDHQQLQTLPVALQRRVVKLILSCLSRQESYDISLEAVERVRSLMTHPHPSAGTYVAGGIFVGKEYDRLCFTKPDFQPPKQYQLVLHIPGITILPAHLGKIEAKITHEPPKKPYDSMWAVFDWDQLPSTSLMVRSRRPGDRMRCFGLNGQKKVKDLFMEAKIPKSERDPWPLIESGTEILWIPGIRRSSIAPISSQTKNYLYFIWRRE
jgi:tRNA(Ile)-lysidine synthase